MWGLQEEYLQRVPSGEGAQGREGDLQGPDHVGRQAVPLDRVSQKVPAHRHALHGHHQHDLHQVEITMPAGFSPAGIILFMHTKVLLFFEKV